MVKPRKSKVSKESIVKKQEEDREFNVDVTVEEREEGLTSESQDEDDVPLADVRVNTRQQRQAPPVTEPPESSDPRDETDGNVHAEMNRPSYLVRLIVISCVVVLLYAVWNSPLQLSPEVTDYGIEEGLDKLAQNFQNQSSWSFRKLKSRLFSYINHTSAPQPFVLMVAATEDNQPTAECFATQVGKLVGKSPLIIKGSNYAASTSDDAKHDIDTQLRSVFGKGEFPTVAIIHDLELIPYGTTTLFYAYCDHDNPMYKEATIIFTVSLPKSYHLNSDEVHREGLVETYLTKDSAWANDDSFDINVMAALLSRITDTVVILNKESTEALQKSC